MIIEGEVLRDDRHAAGYRNFHAFTTPAIRFHPRSETSRDELVSFTVDELVLTSGFIPIDVTGRRLFMHHTYSRIETLNQLRFAVADARFTYAVSNLKRHAGPCAILGGSIDGNWYHWMLNWCLRLVIFRRLRPDLLADDGVRIVVDSAARAQPYRALIDAFGLPEHRLLFVDRSLDHHFEQATVASFCDDHKLYPELIRELSTQLVAGLGVLSQPGGRRLFASRQGLPAPKRRIHNFAELAPVLGAHGFDVLELGAMSARDQAQAFHDAELVVGAHGSDLTNIVFCRPRTRVMVFENRGNVTRGLHLALKYLAEVMDLDYACVLLPSAPVPASMTSDRLAFFHADYVIDAAAFDAQVTQVLAGQRERWTSGAAAAVPASGQHGPTPGLSLSYDEPVDWMPLLVIPERARRDGAAILSGSGAAGYFTDGPYEMLEAGDYRIRLTLTLEEGAPRPVGNDVLCEAVLGERTIGTAGLRLTRDRDDHGLVLRVPQRATEEMELFSLRLRTLSPLAVRLSSATLQRLAEPPPHCETVVQGFIMEAGAPVDWMPLLLVTATARRQGIEIHTTGAAAGYFTDGPHERLEPGDYRIRITLGREDGDPRPLGFDACCEAVLGDRTIGTAGLRLGGGQDDHGLVLRVPQRTTEEMELFSLRLRTLIPLGARLSSMTLQRLPEPPPHSDNVVQGFIMQAGEPVDWMPLLLMTSTARRHGIEICTTGEAAGYFTDGPHEILEAGDYRIGLTLTLEEGAPRPVGNDVLCEAVLGERTIGTAGLRLTRDRDDHGLVLRVPQRATEEMELFSLRLRTLSPLAVRLSSATLQRLAEPPPHSGTVVQGFIMEAGAPVDWMPLLLVTATSRRQGAEIRTTGAAAGYFTDGPHERLEPGDYRIRLTLGREDGDPRPLGFDAFCEAVSGGRTIGTRGLKLRWSQDEHELVLRVPPRRPGETGLFSLRLRVLDPVRVRLSSLVIQRLPAPPDHGEGIEKGFIRLCDDADWLPCMEVHEIGYAEGTDRCSRDAKPGCFLDGPHELLPEGDYRFAITLGLEGRAPRRSAHDVVCEAVLGGRVILTRELKLTAEQETHTLEVRLPPYGDDGTGWFALRLRTVRPQAVRVTRLRVWSTPRRSFSHTPPIEGPTRLASGTTLVKAIGGRIVASLRR